jgi:prolyl oligopeptidase
LSDPLSHDECPVNVRRVAVVLALCALALSPRVGLAQSADESDPFIWLEELEGPKALEWASAENTKTRAVLEQDPRFAGFNAEALKIAEAKDRIPAPSIIDGRVFNFWRDQDHVRGIWRSTTLADYMNAEPQWTTVLDVDTLAASEGKNWIWHGANCESPGRHRCMISLSEGGEDAATVREFDLRTGQFVEGGFVLPRGKQDVQWISDDTLLVAREWVPGEVTSSGYPLAVRTVARGATLEGATELSRGLASDVAHWPLVLVDGAGHRAVAVARAITFFTTEFSLRTPAGLRRLAVPLKSELAGLIQNRLLIRLAEPWTVNGTRYAEGALLSVDLAEAMADPGHLRPTLVYAPGPRESFGGAAATRDRLLVVTYENVRGRAFIYTPEANGGWSHRRLDLPDNSAIRLGSADDRGSDAFVSVTSFLVPTTLMRVDANAGTAMVAKSTPPRFDASRHVAEQFEVASKDGTKVPYFVVRPKDMKLDGSTPTIMTAYGGFEVTNTPGYLGTVGKLWIERGGAYVLANIRGGGEFGPAWHQAGLKTNRQRIYDDFTAVAKDVIARRITSPRRFGIWGGSNGGLLMGVAMTQHPELYNAVDIAVPLLDMLRYEKIQAGASWVGEYGSVSVPAERAFLASISPYHNLRKGVKYPEPLVWSTTKDDRVGPQHARKFAAKMSAMGLPYLFYEVHEGGHGSGANAKEQAFTDALQFSYFARKLMDQPAIP